MFTVRVYVCLRGGGIVQCVSLWCHVGMDCVLVAMCMWVIGVGNEGVLLVCMYSVTGPFMHV